MAEEPWWVELHDLEGRVGRVEDEVLEKRTEARVRAEDRKARLERYGKYFSWTLAFVSTSLLVLRSLGSI